MEAGSPRRSGQQWESLDGPSQGEAGAAPQSEFSPQGRGCWKLDCRGKKQSPVCLCEPQCSLWLFKSALQSAYTSQGDFDPYSSLNSRHTPESTPVDRHPSENSSSLRQAERHFSQKWVRLVARHPKGVRLREDFESEREDGSAILRSPKCHKRTVS